MKEVSIIEDLDKGIDLEELERVRKENEDERHNREVQRETSKDRK